VSHALVYQTVEGSDEAPLDGSSSMVRVRDGETEETTVTPESLGLPRVTRGQIPWTDADDETRSVLAILEGEDGPVKALILYNAALRIWMADEAESVWAGVENASEAIQSGASLGLLDTLRQPIDVPTLNVR
jgi:anthranilate phosphoribosyltransferase